MNHNIFNDNFSDFGLRKGTIYQKDAKRCYISSSFVADIQYTFIVYHQASQELSVEISQCDACTIHDNFLKAFNKYLKIRKLRKCRSIT